MTKSKYEKNVCIIPNGINRSSRTSFSSLQQKIVCRKPTLRNCSKSTKHVVIYSVILADTCNFLLQITICLEDAQARMTVQYHQDIKVL